MAEKTASVKAEEKSAAERAKELVPFYAFKDNERYKDDIVVAVNGKVYRIQRGVHVQIPRYVYDVLEASRRQDLYTANLIEKQQEEYNRAASMLN